MLIVVYNKSRKKRLKQSKRILSSLLLPVYDRLHIGNVPVRNIIQLIKNLKKLSGSGMNIKIFIESKEGYHGFKLINIGKKEKKLENMLFAKSNIDDKLIKNNIIKPYFKKSKKK